MVNIPRPVLLGGGFLGIKGLVDNKIITATSNPAGLTQTATTAAEHITKVTPHINNAVSTATQQGNLMHLGFLSEHDMLPAAKKVITKPPVHHAQGAAQGILGTLGQSFGAWGGMLVRFGQACTSLLGGHGFAAFGSVMAGVSLPLLAPAAITVAAIAAVAIFCFKKRHDAKVQTERAQVDAAMNPGAPEGAVNSAERMQQRTTERGPAPMATPDARGVGQPALQM